MATTNAYSGNSAVTLTAQAAFSGDTSGNRRASLSVTRTYAASGGTAPTVSGFLRGLVTVAAGDILLAHASDPFGAMGDSTWYDGFAPASSKLKALLLKNCHASIGITVSRGAANGLPFLAAASDAFYLQPNGLFFMEWPDGLAALTTGSNDKITLAPDSGNPTMELMAVFGP